MKDVTKIGDPELGLVTWTLHAWYQNIPLISPLGYPSWPSSWPSPSLATTYYSMASLPHGLRIFTPVHFLQCGQRLGFLKFKPAHFTFTLEIVTGSSSPKKSMCFALLFKMPANGFGLTSSSCMPTRRYILGLSNSTRRKDNGFRP